MQWVWVLLFPCGVWSLTQTSLSSRKSGSSFVGCWKMTGLFNQPLHYRVKICSASSVWTVRYGLPVFLQHWLEITIISDKLLCSPHCSPFARQWEKHIFYIVNTDKILDLANPYHSCVVNFYSHVLILKFLLEIHVHDWLRTKDSGQLSRLMTVLETRPTHISVKPRLAKRCKVYLITSLPATNLRHMWLELRESTGPTVQSFSLYLRGKKTHMLESLLSIIPEASERMRMIMMMKFTIKIMIGMIILLLI